MGKAIKLSEDMVGKKVRCICKDNCYYPEVGMIGTIVEYDCRDKDISYKVQWPKGSTFGEDCWWVLNKYIELVEDGEEIPNMTNEEIWTMLRPKLEKNGLVPAGRLEDIIGSTPAYDEIDVINAIALAYKVGYLRSQKGRPFKFHDRKVKKGGHWEPVDPNNLPKEGTKVRYARNCADYLNYKNPVIVIGDLGKVDTSFAGWFGVRLDNPRSVYKWISFHNNEIANSLDMWVEDDE